MPVFPYTVASAIAEAKKGTLSAAIITEIIGDAPKSKTHADAHMKSEDFWTTQRTTKTGKVGTTETTDGHLKSEYAKRTSHSMFDSPISAVEAVTGALNTPIGEAALTTLMGQSDGVDLYSRTAVETLAGTKQITRTKTDKSDTTATLAKSDAEYVVVCLRKDNSNYLIIASAYPVSKDPANETTEAGKDWYQLQSNKSIVKALPKVSPAKVPW